METIVDEILNSANMMQSTRKFVDANSHDNNVDLYQALTYAYFDMNEDDDRISKLEDILDAMSGHCHKECRIGTGDYAW
jgi:hypothetical protein